MAGGFVPKEVMDELGPNTMANVRKLFIEVLEKECPQALEQ